MTRWMWTHRRASALVAAVLASLVAVSVVLAFSFQSSRFIGIGIKTGFVRVDVVRAFTDDDDKVDDPARDANDRGDCPDVSGVALPGSTTGTTSCDPAASGPDPKPRLDQDIARCDITGFGGSSVVGNIGIAKINAYPGYFCTSWFELKNTGTLPAKILDVQVCDGNFNNCQSMKVFPQVTNVDLDGDGTPDVAVDLTEIEPCLLISPGQTQFMDIDQEVISPRAAASLSESVAIYFGGPRDVCPPPPPTPPPCLPALAGLPCPTPTPTGG